MTDNARNYTVSRAFAATIEELGARHKVTRPFRPQTDVKAERFIQTMLAEWAYARLYHSNNERLAALDPWVEHYNYRRPHSALEGRSPMATLVNNVFGNHT